MGGIMGLFDKIKKDTRPISKPEKLEKKTTESGISRGGLVSSDETRKLQFNKTAPQNIQNIKITSENAIDNYSLKIDDVVFNIIIEKKDGRMYYTIPEVSQIIDTLSKFSEENIMDIKNARCE